MDLIKEISRLKKEKGALILAHYYQRPEIQDIADYVGDSYYLSKLAKDSAEKVIVFCGVKFMAESAKILSPEKTVLLPAMDAGCPMADMADEDGVKELINKHNDAAVVCYINSSTEVKALCDVSVTSSNALNIINKLDKKKIIFLPDKNLGSYIAEQVPDKEFILWPGFCITHRKINSEQIKEIKQLKPKSVLLVHPECEKEIRDQADFIGSTSEIIDFATKSPAKDFIVATEQGVLHQLKDKNPTKNFFFPGNSTTCINMKKTKLEDVYKALTNMTENEIHLNEEIRQKASKSLINMHQLARG